MSRQELTHFPAQKKPISKKNDKWRRKNIDAAEDMMFSLHQNLRRSFANKRINYDLYSNILDQEDIERICNPLQLQGLLVSPAKMQNYPIVVPKIDLLVGESIRRPFDFVVRVGNDDAISSKESELQNMFLELITGQIQVGQEAGEDVSQLIDDFQRFKSYEYQDLRERRATQILSHLNKEQRLPYKFSKGFKDALICGEEIYHIDIIQGQPIVERLNPLHVHTVRSGTSPFIEDSDVIVIENFESPGKIIDDYHDELTPKQIDQIEQGLFSGDPSSTVDIGEKAPINIDLNNAISLAVLENDLDFKHHVDQDGNIRVLKVYWKSRRKMLKVTFIDEFGDEQVRLEDEHYKVDENIGESSETMWINEWWEGHKVGGSSVNDDNRAIYLRMRPRPVQFRRMENPSLCHPGIVGTIYQTNDNQAVSLMDRMKPYQYMYNILMYNAELAISKNYGKIMSLDLARIPENWNIDQWMSFAQGMNVAVIDSFKESNKGATMGKLAGQINAPTPVIDLEMGNTIQLYMSMMQFIKQEMGEISGVSEARQGQISTRSAVGNVEREVVQSSMITEYWFNEHEHTKKRVMETLLETAKIAWKDDGNKKVQFVLDSGATEIIEFDGQDFAEVDYDIHITSGGVEAQARDTIKQLAQAGLQNQLITFTQLMDILSTQSTASVKRKLEAAEKEKIERDEQARQEQNQLAQQQIQANQQAAQMQQQADMAKMQNENEQKQLDRENKITLENIKAQAKLATTNNDDTIDQQKANANDLKISNDKQIADAKLREDQRNNRTKEDLEQQKIDISARQTDQNTDS